MKWKGKWKYLVRVSVIFICILLGNTKTQMIAKEETWFSMDVSINFNQYVKCNRSANVLVHIRTKRSNFDGYIKAIPKTKESQLKCIYKKAVCVRNGVKTVEFTIPVDGTAKRMEFQLVDMNEKVVFSQKKKLKIERDVSVSFLGIIGKQKCDSQIDGKRVRPIRIPYDEVPQSVEGLDSFENIIIKSEVLNEESLSVLRYVKEWNLNGGTVIISSYSEPLIQYMGVDRKTQKTILDKNQKEVYHVFQNEKGVIIEWLYSKSLIELLNENTVDNDRLLFELKSHYSDIKEMQVENEKSKRDLGERDLIKSLEYFGKEHLPRPVQYAALLFLYVIFVGPVLYLILRYRKKVRYYYIAVAVTSFISIGLFMAVGMKTALDKIIMHTVTIYDYDDARDNVTEESYFSIVAPSRKSGKFTVRRKANISLKNVRIDSKIPYTSIGGRKKCDVAIQQKSNSVSIEIPRPLYMKPYVFKSISQDQKKGKIISDLAYDGKNISGCLVNLLGFDLKNVVLLSNYHLITLGNLGNGEKIHIPNYQKVVNFHHMYRERNEQLGNIRMVLEQDWQVEFQKEAAIRYCMKGKCSEYNNETYLVGLISENKSSCEDYDICSSKYTKLVVYRIRNVVREYKQKTILNDISRYEELLVGAIDPNTRTMRSYYAVADYYIPSDTKMVSLWFNQAINMKTYYKGTVSIYNNKTQEFEKIYRGRSSKCISDLDKKNYITNGNFIKLKYALPVEEECIEKNDLPIISALLEVK